MSELKALSIQLIEENVALQVENDNLKSLMAKSEQDVEAIKVTNRIEKDNKPMSKERDNKSSIKHVKKPLPSKDNLAVLYAKDSIFVMENYLVNTDMVRIVYYV